jgi:GTP-binding protein HflX
VAAFRATLEEVTEADLLLHVVDITHPNALEQSRAVEETLVEIEATGKPVVVALNKIDKLENPPLIQEMVAGFPNSLAISARETVLNQELMYVTVCIPYHESGLVSLFHRQGTVEREEHSKEGTVLGGRLPARYLEAFRHYLV